MKIIGIDPGIATTGFGVIEFSEEDEKFEMIDFGIIKTSPKKDFSERLQDIGKDLEFLIEKFKPDYSAVESIFFSKNVKTAISVSHARGVILYVLQKNNLSLKEFTPLEIKNMICGYGKAEKQQVQKIVSIELELNKVPKQDDAADALAVAICGARYFQRQNINTDSY